MSLYTGTGVRCRVSAACGFRVMPAGGDDVDLNEAARIVVAHERACRYAKIVPDKPLERNTSLEERRANVALQTAELDEPAPPIAIPAAVAREVFRTAGEGRFLCTCKICGDKFRATGPRSQFCPKTSCQSRRSVAA